MTRVVGRTRISERTRISAPGRAGARWRRRARRLLAAAVCCAALGVAGCAPLYLPPVLEAREVEGPALVTGDSRLALEGETLVATLYVEGVDEAGWLALQWYDPALREVASDSVWLDPATQVEPLRVAAPPTLALRDGRWRVVVSFEGLVLRQLDALVGHGGE